MITEPNDWSIKLNIRRECIINPYRAIFSRHSIPDQIPDHELDQMLKVGLITKEQFCGVEIEEDLHNQNATMTGPNFIYGEFQTEFEAAYARSNGEFNPDVVHVDLGFSFPETNAKMFTRVLNTLFDAKIRNVLVVVNFTTQAWASVFLDTKTM
ncbi:MAG: hypothetical protein ACTSWQ_07735 [Candidatus Thorarchaeota archaeon]